MFSQQVIDYNMYVILNVEISIINYLQLLVITKTQ